jgi:hypothetical protein
MTERMGRRNKILTGSDEGLNGLIELGKDKAELAGIEYVLGYPRRAVEDADLEIMAVREEMQIENEV